METHSKSQRILSTLNDGAGFKEQLLKEHIVWFKSRAEIGLSKNSFLGRMVEGVVDRVLDGLEH